jgi:WD40 repeat protein
MTEPHYDTVMEKASAPPPNGPVLSHRMKHDKSILALAVNERFIFAGTLGGEILVYSLETYERRKVIEAHRGSVLGLCLSQDQSLLFSSATDPIVNVGSDSSTIVNWLDQLTRDSRSGVPPPSTASTHSGRPTMPAISSASRTRPITRQYIWALRIRAYRYTNQKPTLLKNTNKISGTI